MEARSLFVDVEIRGFVGILIYEGGAIDFHGLTMPTVSLRSLPVLVGFSSLGGGTNRLRYMKFALGAESL